MELSVPVDSAYALINGPRRDTTVTRVWIGRFGQPTVVLNAIGQRAEAIRSNTAFPGLVTELRTPNASSGGYLVRQAQYDATGRVAVQRLLDPRGAGGQDSTRFSWHPTLDVVTKIVPPEGDSTTYGFDSSFGSSFGGDV